MSLDPWTQDTNSEVAGFDFLEEEEVFANQIPIEPNSEYYHSTSDIYKESIEKHGLCMRNSTKVKSPYWGKEEVFSNFMWISKVPDIVWGENAARELGGTPIIFVIKGEDIISAGCKAYPDYNHIQPIDKDRNIVINKVEEIVLTNCDCVKVSYSMRSD